MLRSSDVLSCSEQNSSALGLHFFLLEGRRQDKTRCRNFKSLSDGLCCVPEVRTEASAAVLPTDISPPHCRAGGVVAVALERGETRELPSNRNRRRTQPPSRGPLTLALFFLLIRDGSVPSSGPSSWRIARRRGRPSGHRSLRRLAGHLVRGRHQRGRWRRRSVRECRMGGPYPDLAPLFNTRSTHRKAVLPPANSATCDWRSDQEEKGGRPATGTRRRARTATAQGESAGRR